MAQGQPSLVPLSSLALLVLLPNGIGVGWLSPSFLPVAWAGAGPDGQCWSEPPLLPWLLDASW